MLRHPFLALLAALFLLASFGPTPAEAKRPKQTQTEATFLSWDAEAHTITVKVRRTGRGKGPKLPPQLRIKRGQSVTFNVKEEGSVLTSTIVKSKQGTRMDFEELRPGSKVFVFWLPDEKDESARFARSIAIYVAAQDWTGAQDVAPAKAAKAD
jgi:hypothetical protein